MDWQILAWGRLADAAAGGLIVLAAGSLAARLCRQPVRRARLVVLTLLGAVAVPGLGALPVAPRWSAGLLPAPAAILGSRRPCGPRRAQEPTSPARAAAGSRVALGPIEQPGEIADGPRPDRTRPRRLGAGGVRARGRGGISPPRGRSCSGVISRWRPGWRPGGSSGRSCSGG